MVDYQINLPEASVMLKGTKKIRQRFSPRRVKSIVPRRQVLSPRRVKMRRPRRQGKGTEVLKGLGRKWGSQLDCSSSVLDSL